MGKETITKYPATYDTIVFDTGISGGLAAKELCENGLKNLSSLKSTHGKAY